MLFFLFAFCFDNPAGLKDRPDLAPVPLWIDTHPLISFQQKQLRRVGLCLRLGREL